MRYMHVALTLVAVLVPGFNTLAQPIAVASRLVTSEGKPVHRARVTLSASDTQRIAVGAATPNFDGLFVVTHGGVQPGTKLYLYVDDGVITEPITFEAPAGGGPVRTVAMAPITAIAEAGASTLTPEQAAYATAAAYKTAAVKHQLGLLTHGEAVNEAARRSGYAIARVDGNLNELFPDIRGKAIELAGESLARLAVEDEMLLAAAESRIEQRKNAIDELTKGTVSNSTAMYVLDLQPSDIQYMWVDARAEEAADPRTAVDMVFTRLGATLDVGAGSDAEVLIYPTCSHSSIAIGNRLSYAALDFTMAQAVAPIRLEDINTKTGYRRWLEKNSAARDAIFFTSLLERSDKLEAKTVGAVADRIDAYEARVKTPKK